MMNFQLFHAIERDALIPSIIQSYHVPLRDHLEQIKKLLPLIKKSKIIGDFTLVEQLLSQFSQEILEHINREEDSCFPLIQKLFRGDGLTEGEIKKLQILLHSQHNEHHEIDNYILGVGELLRKIEHIENEDIFLFVQTIYTIIDSTKDHLYLEDKILNHHIIEKLKNLGLLT